MTIHAKIQARTPAGQHDIMKVDELEYVTLKIGDQLFGLPIQEVHEVFAAHHMTRVPLAPSAIKGLLNLRGRVVTALCLRTVLQLPPSEAETNQMAIGVEIGGEPFALLVDEIGDVLRLAHDTHEANPIHMTSGWQHMSRGIHRLESCILVVLDLQKIVFSHSLAA